MFGLGIQEIIVLGVVCGLPFIGITIVVIVLMITKKRSPQDDE